MASKSAVQRSSQIKRSDNRQRPQPIQRQSPMNGSVPNPAEMQKRLGNQGTQQLLRSWDQESNVPSQDIETKPTIENFGGAYQRETANEPRQVVADQSISNNLSFSSIDQRPISNRQNEESEDGRGEEEKTIKMTMAGSQYQNGAVAEKTKASEKENFFHLNLLNHRDQKDEFSASHSSGDRPLPFTTRARMEATFDHDFGHVRINTGGNAAAAAAEHKAHAFTVGSNISFGSGEFAPHTKSGDQLLAHELTHVIQHDEGRMPSSGVLDPQHELEQEAYANENRIAATLPSIDEKLGTQDSSSGASSRYRGEPKLIQAIDGAYEKNGELWGINATQKTSNRSLPNTDELRPDVSPTEQIPETLNARHIESFPIVPDMTGEAQGSPAAFQATPQPETTTESNQILQQMPTATTAAESSTSSPALVLQSAPPLHDPMAWIDALTSEGAQRVEAMQASATGSVGRIRAQAQVAIRDASSSFDTARTRFASTAQTTFAAIEAFRTNGAQRISSEVAAQATELDSHFATSSESARGSAEEACTRIEQNTENEANRSISESVSKSERARGLAETGSTNAEPPLAGGQLEIASRVSEEMAQQCLQTGRDAAAEVRKVGTMRSAGIDSFLSQVLQTLESALNVAHDKLSQSEAEASVVLEEQATRITEEVAARQAEGISALDQQEAIFTSWIEEKSEQQCTEISTRAEQGVTNLTANIESISERFNEIVLQVEPIFAGGSTEELDIGPAQDAFNVEMSRIWTVHVAPQLAEGDQLATSFDDHAGGVEQGLMQVSADALATLEQSVNETITGLETLGDRFGSFVESAAERLLGAVRDGIAGTCVEADRAVAEHNGVVTSEADQAQQAIQTAVDQQLAWEDQQVDRAAAEITAGQAQAEQQYQSLVAQARAMDADGASSAVARGWLGDLWGWFSDLANSTLEWLQEKLGPVWGNIVGQILRAIIYVVGVVVCAVAWVGAQVINLVWGFIWGETAIPGYGGGVFAFIGDLVAGVLVIGDIRDLFKYGIWRPFIMGEAFWGINAILFFLTIVFMIPVAGDILKVIVKGIKGGSKSLLKLLIKTFGHELAERILRKLGIEIAEEVLERLAREVGQELAERMIRELGEEAAEELLERLGKETIQHLGQEISPTIMRNLADELGERTLRRLAESLGGNVIQTLSTDLGREAIEKLLRTVTPEIVGELHSRLGKDILVKLLEGLRGVTIKEYLDILGEAALRNLGRDLNGHAVKELFDDLGADLLRRLATDLSGETVQQLANELGERLLRELTEEFGVRGVKELFDGLGAQLIRELTGEFGARGLKELVDDIGAESIGRLVREFTAAGLKQVHDELGRALFREFATEFSAASFKRLIDKLGARTARELAEAIGVREVRTLTQKFGYEGLAELVNEIGVQGIRDVGVRGLKNLSGHFTPRQIGEWIADVGTVEMRRLAETYSGRALLHYGRAWMKAYRGVTAQTQHHLLVGEFNGAGHLRAGCHDKAAFDAVVAAGNAVIDATRTRVSGIYTEYWYRRPTQVVGNEGPKTVVDGLAVGWAVWADRIRRATDALIRERKFPTNPGQIPQTTIEGASWRGYFRNDEIATFFPEI